MIYYIGLSTSKICHWQSRETASLEPMWLTLSIGSENVPCPQGLLNERKSEALALADPNPLAEMTQRR